MPAVIIRINKRKEMFNVDIRDSDIKVSKELIPYICTIKDGETITDKVNLPLILGLFASQVVTLKKASELAGKSVRDFIEVLKTYHVLWGEYTGEEMQMDHLVINKITGGFYR